MTPRLYGIIFARYIWRDLYCIKWVFVYNPKSTSGCIESWTKIAMTFRILPRIAFEWPITGPIMHKNTFTVDDGQWCCCQVGNAHNKYDYDISEKVVQCIRFPRRSFLCVKTRMRSSAPKTTPPDPKLFVYSILRAQPKQPNCPSVMCNVYFWSTHTRGHSRQRYRVHVRSR